MAERGHKGTLILLGIQIGIVILNTIPWERVVDTLSKTKKKGSKVAKRKKPKGARRRKAA